MRKIIFPTNKPILKLCSLVVFLLLIVSCNKHQATETNTVMPDSTPTPPKEIATSISTQTIIPTNSPLLLQFSPTASIFDPLGTLLFTNTDAVTIVDISSKSQLGITSAPGIYTLPVATKNGYIYYLSDHGKSRGIMNVYRVKLGEKVPEPITFDNYFDYGLASCYSQNIVAYVSDQHEINGTYNIYISGFRNSIGSKKILSTTQRITGLSCAPDGKRLAFFMPGNNGILGDLYVANIDGTSLTQLVQKNNTLTYSLSWSPDSQYIVVAVKTGNGDSLTIVNILGKTIRELTNVEIGLNIKAPVWAPNGSKILFEVFDRNTTKLKVIDYDGHNEKLLLDSAQDGGFFSYSAVWSPDSEYIAYVLRGDNKTVNLYILSVVGGVQEELLPEDYTSITALSWISPTP